MRKVVFRLFALGLLGMVALSGPACAGAYEDGLAAYEAGEFLIASGYFYDAANRGHIQAQHRLGVMYERGQGVMRDRVMAHMWFTLAASSTAADPALSAAAANARDRVARKMDRRQMSDAFLLALNWKPAGN